jgi:hypothetical protein
MAHPTHGGCLEAPDATRGGSIACVVAELCRVFAAWGRGLGGEGRREREGEEEGGGRDSEPEGGGGRGEGRGGRGKPACRYICISAWYQPPIFASALQAKPSMPELPDDARAVLRDIILVFDLDDGGNHET